MPWYERLYPEQKKVFRFIAEKIIPGGGVGLFAEQGTGKTIITMAILEAICPRLALIIAPLTSLDITWSERLETLGRPVLRRAEELKHSPDGGILLIHPEAIRKQAEKLAKVPWDIVVWDESQNIKNRSSANSRAARRLRFARRRLALSGTPLDDSQIDVWAQMRFINHEVFGENWTDFAQEYCHKAGYMGKQWVFSKRKHQQFLDAIGDHAIRLSNKFMKLPPLTLNPFPVQMFGNQDRLYQRMDSHSLIEVDGTKIVASLTVTKDVKKAQITGGHIIDDDGVSHHVGNAKMRGLHRLIGKLEKPIVIFCHYLSEMDEIVRQLSKTSARVAFLRGKVKGEARTNVIKNFQKGDYDVFVCQVRTGGVSIELSRASSLIFYSFNYSYIDFEQIIRRLHRGGQTRPVNVWLIYCVGTIDEEKLSLIEKKAELSAQTLEPLERRT